MVTQKNFAYQRSFALVVQASAYIFGKLSYLQSQGTGTVGKAKKCEIDLDKVKN